VWGGGDFECDCECECASSIASQKQNATVYSGEVLESSQSLEPKRTRLAIIKCKLGPVHSMKACSGGRD
jgi:hypothetical protein